MKLDELPPKTRAAVKKISKDIERKISKYTMREILEIQEFSRFPIHLKNYSPTEWCEVIERNKMMTPEIIEEMKPYILGADNE